VQREGRCKQWEEPDLDRRVVQNRHLRGRLRGRVTIAKLATDGRVSNGDCDGSC
jgi:hypothetical protein